MDSILISDSEDEESYEQILNIQKTEPAVFFSDDDMELEHEQNNYQFSNATNTEYQRNNDEQHQQINSLLLSPETEAYGIYIEDDAQQNIADLCVVKLEEEIIDISDDESQPNVNIDVSSSNNNVSGYANAVARNNDNTARGKNAIQEKNDNILGSQRIEEVQIPFQCQLCMSFFQEEGALQHHMSWHAANNEFFPCTQCSASFRNSKNLETHLKKCHLEKRFQCKFCSIKFGEEELLATHIMKIHTEQTEDLLEIQHQLSSGMAQNKPFCCTLCPRSFQQVTSLNVHLRWHSADKPFQCEPCGRKFVQKNNLFIHIQKRHAGRMIYKCKMCPMKYDRLQFFHRHLERHCQQYQRISLECKLCDVSFTEKEALQQHMDGHADKTPFQCRICDAFLSSLTSKYYHLETHENAHSLLKISSSMPKGSRKRGIKCLMCNKLFKSIRWLSNHMKFHEENPFSCTICGKAFQTQEYLDQHRSICDTMLQPSRYECSICNKTFSRSNWLALHMRMHSDLSRKKLHARNSGSWQTVRQYQCKICQKVFGQSNWLLSHMKTHKQTRFYCKICDKSFITSQLLDEHVPLHDNEKPFRCQYCSESFGLVIALRRHMNVHALEKPVECDVCGKLYTSAKDMNVHKAKIHLSEESLQDRCPICGKMFASKFYLRHHIKLHIDSARYQCKLCRKQLCSNASLQMHLRRRHLFKRVKKVGKTIIDGRIIKRRQRSRRTATHFECYLCKKSITMLFNLRRHMRIHTGERPFKCGMCPLQFIDKQAQQKHIRKIHTGERYACELCDRQFLDKPNLYHHRQQKHSDGQQHSTVTRTTPHKCDICHKMLSSKMSLQNHLTMHIHGRRVPCSFCSRKFTLKSQLKHHIKVKHNIDTSLLYCSLCKERFAEPYVFIEHMRNCHNVTL